MTASISNRAALKPRPTLNNRPRSGEGSMVCVRSGRTVAMRRHSGGFNELLEGGKRGRARLRHGDAPRTVEPLMPVTGAEPGYHDRAGAAARGMHEAVIAQIDADVGERVIKGIEENQVARLEIRLMIEGLRRFAD